MSMAYPGLKFVYNWADSEWIYVEIDDTERGYFWPDYVEFDDSFEWHDWYKVVPDNEGGDTRDASYTYNQYFNNEERYWYITPKTLKEDFLECFENHLYDSLFNASTSYHSYSNIGSDYKEISTNSKKFKCDKCGYEYKGGYRYGFFNRKMEWNYFGLS